MENYLTLKTEVFDPDSIPVQLYSDYELMKINNQSDTRSVFSGFSGVPESEIPPGYSPSEFGGENNNNRLSAFSNLQSHVYEMPPMSDISSSSIDDKLLNEIRNILSKSDLMTVTKKSVRLQLSETFGMDLSHKRNYINNCIERILKGEI